MKFTQVDASDSFGFKNKKSKKLASRLTDLLSTGISLEEASKQVRLTPARAKELLGADV